MASGEMSPSEFTAFLNVALSHLHAFTRDGAIHFIFMDWRHLGEIQDAARPLFGSPRQLCVWAKDNGGMGTFYRSQHELVFVFKKGSAPHINNFGLGDTGRYRTNVWDYPGVNSRRTDALANWRCIRRSSRSHWLRRRSWIARAAATLSAFSQTTLNPRVSVEYYFIPISNACGR